MFIQDFFNNNNNKDKIIIINKPSYENHYPNGIIRYQEWYENGIHFSDKQVLQRKQQWLNKIIFIIDKEGNNYYG